jgi:hypothetical protein
VIEAIREPPPTQEQAVKHLYVDDDPRVPNSIIFVVLNPGRTW